MLWLGYYSVPDMYFPGTISVFVLRFYQCKYGIFYIYYMGMTTSTRASGTRYGAFGFAMSNYFINWVFATKRTNFTRFQACFSHCCQQP